MTPKIFLLQLCVDLQLFFELGVIKNFMQKFNRKTLHDYLFVQKAVLDCISFIQNLNRLRDAGMMKNIKKKNHVNGLALLFSNSYNIRKPYPLHLNMRINVLNNLTKPLLEKFDLHEVPVQLLLPKFFLVFIYFFNRV